MAHQPRYEPQSEEARTIDGMIWRACLLILVIALGHSCLPDSPEHAATTAVQTTPIVNR